MRHHDRQCPSIAQGRMNGNAIDADAPKGPAKYVPPHLRKKVGDWRETKWGFVMNLPS